MGGDGAWTVGKPLKLKWKGKGGAKKSEDEVEIQS